MSLKDFTNRKAVQLLATQSRRADINPTELCKIHFEMGKYLAYEILEEFELSEREIQHVQGIKKGVELVDKGNIVIFTLMRAGLYAAEGVRSVFTESQFVFSNDAKETQSDFKTKTVIIIDAVINTGKSIEKVIGQLQKQEVRKIIIATLIIQKDALYLTKTYPDISFYALRISANKYIGKGGTDTGNRLFNTVGV